ATTTTIAFTPPDATAIVAFVQADANNASLDEACTVTSTGGLSWTLARRVNGATDSNPSTVEVWYTYAATSPGSITVSVTDNKGSVDKSLFVRVFTGTDSTVVGAKANTTTDTVTYTSTVNNSWGWGDGLGGNTGTLAAAANNIIVDSTAVAGFDGGDT